MPMTTRWPSFVDTFKAELIADRVWRSRSQLELAVVEHVSWFTTSACTNPSAMSHLLSSRTYTFDRGSTDLPLYEDWIQLKESPWNLVRLICGSEHGRGRGGQATQIHATAGQAHQALLHGNQVTEHVFTTTADTVKCTQGTNAATESVGVTVTATYTGCQGFGQAAVIDMNGCKFLLTGQKDVFGSTIANKTVNVDITGCTTGKSIEVTTAICRVSVPEQHNLKQIVLSNGSEPRHDVTANINVSGIHYRMHGPLCPKTAVVTETRTDGTFVGQTTVQAYQTATTAQVTKHGHQFQEHQPGSKLGLQVT